jgi:hypothetical protein
MNGFICRGLAVVCMTGSLALAGGCHHLDDYVDPCWPERYEFAARKCVNSAFLPQINNGHVLDQTVWNYHFEAGTDKLTEGGQAHLAYLARRRPCPDTMVYVQTAQDVNYDPANPDRFTEGRSNLDSKRVEAVQKYLNAYTAGRATTFQVLVHDPNEVGIAAQNANIAVRKWHGSASGYLPQTGSNVAGNLPGAQ